MNTSEQQLQRDIHTILKDSASKAYMSLFKGMIVDNDMFENVKSISESFGKVFADNASGPMASAITQHIQRGVVTVNLSECPTPQALTSATGPVTGPLIGVITTGVDFL